MAEIGTQLAQTRKLLGLTLRQAENLSGVSNAYISQLETGHIKQPSPDMLEKLALAYRLPYATVMEAAGYVMPKDQETRPTLPAWLETAAALLSERDWRVVEAVVQALIAQKEG